MATSYRNSHVKFRGGRIEDVPNFTGTELAYLEMCCVSEAGSHLRLMDSCITQLKAQGPSRTCNESKEEEEEAYLVEAGRR